MLEDEHDRPDEPAPSESETHGLLERVKEWLGKPPSREYGAAREENTEFPTVLPPPD